MQQFSSPLLTKRVLPGETYLMRFGLPAGLSFSFAAGQYAIITVPQEGKDPVKRLYSIASAPGLPYFELLIKPLPGGASQTYWKMLTEGSSVDVFAPAGVFAMHENPKGKVFLCTGTGYAPMRSFIFSHPNHTENYYLLWGMPKYEDVYLLDELKTLNLQNPRFHPTVCLSRETSLEAVAPENRPFFSLGRINNALQTLISSQPPGSLDFYICGNQVVTESLRDYLYNQNIGKEAVFFERY